MIAALDHIGHGAYLDAHASALSLSQPANASSSCGLVEMVEQPSQMRWNTSGTHPPPARWASTTWFLRFCTVQVGSTPAGVRIWYGSATGGNDSAGAHRSQPLQRP